MILVHTKTSPTNEKKSVHWVSSSFFFSVTYINSDIEPNAHG